MYVSIIKEFVHIKRKLESWAFKEIIIFVT